MKLYVSTGNSRMDKKWNGTYKKLSKAKQDDIKDVGGFVLGRLKGGRRKKDCVISRSAVTLDMDYGREGIIDEIEMFFDMKMMIYSTHKHTPENPRLRLIIPLSREITPDEYGAVSRKIAEDIGTFKSRRIRWKRRAYRCVQQGVFHYRGD